MYLTHLEKFPPLLNLVLFFGGTGAWPQASNLVGRCSTTWAIPLALNLMLSHLFLFVPSFWGRMTLDLNYSSTGPRVSLFIVFNLLSLCWSYWKISILSSISLFLSSVLSLLLFSLSTELLNLDIVFFSSKISFWILKKYALFLYWDFKIFSCVSRMFIFACWSIF
jgi:hypothetical protein